MKPRGRPSTPWVKTDPAPWGTAIKSGSDTNGDPDTRSVLSTEAARQVPLQSCGEPVRQATSKVTIMPMKAWGGPLKSVDSVHIAA